MALRPGWGEIGPPLKETGKRADFRPDWFTTLLESKGNRMAWRRASMCPCTPVNDQTEQADPNCTLCKGKGWYYFGLRRALILPKIGDLDAIQKQIIGVETDDPAAVIRVLMTGISANPDALDRQGMWVAGDAQLTVRYENRLGYWDRLVDLDTEMVYSELLDQGAGRTLPSRYPITQANEVRTFGTVYKAEEDFTLVEGVLTWKTGKGPASGAKVAVHYLHHPTWLVVDHPHVIRMTSLKLKRAEVETPEGTPQSLPLQAHARLEYLVT